MYYVYVIYSKALDNFYLGYSKDLRKRIESHKSGRSKYTSQTRDWILVYYEAYASEKLARLREAKLKRANRMRVLLYQRLREELTE